MNSKSTFSFTLGHVLFFVVIASLVLGAFLRGFQLLGIGVAFLFAMLVVFLAVVAWEVLFGKRRSQGLKIATLAICSLIVGAFIIAPQWFNWSFAQKIDVRQRAIKADHLMHQIVDGVERFRDVTWNVKADKVVTIDVRGEVATLEDARELAKRIRDKLRNLKFVGYSFTLIIKETNSFFTG